MNIVELKFEYQLFFWDLGYVTEIELYLYKTNLIDGSSFLDFCW